MTTIETRQVSLGYGHKTVLRDISFNIAPGEMVGLIGPNGCGKSTVIKALSRIIPHQKGNIRLDGKDVNAIPRSELARRLAVVPQIPLLPSAFTAFEIVLMGRNPHLGLFQREGPKEMALTWQAMALTGTQSFAERRVGELSGGEIQCLLIARALVQETGAILLDEPTANLDIGRQIEVLDLMKQLCAEKRLAVLAALHDLNLAAQYCDRLILLNEGRVHAEGTPQEVITTHNIQEVYGPQNCVYAHPVNGLPTVLLTTGNGKSRRPEA
ncbi:MAG: ABC transporter ATP-binding protein [Dehalococcoidales bacterium]|nr:ABC transporter ATP-binding protein [Dehalococcoidales bacterium]